MAAKKKATKKAAKADQQEETPARKMAGARHDDTAAFLEKFKQRKTIQIKSARDTRSPYFLRRPTGICSLDLALAGGFPAGSIVEVWGPESSGKTFLSYLTAAKLQRNYGDDSRILIFKTEMREDKDFARLAGLCVAYSADEIEEMDRARVERLRLPAFSSEDIDDLQMEIGDIIYLTAATAEHGFDTIVDALEANLFQLAIIDSVGALLTETVEKGSVGDAHYAGGGSSRAVTQFMNQVFPRLIMDRADGSMVETTILGINQIRAKMDVSAFESKFPGAKEKPAMAAWAWKHGQQISLKLTKSGKFTEEKGGDSEGHSVTWQTMKGKAGTHDGLRGSYDFWHVPRSRPVFWRDVQRGLIPDIHGNEEWIGGIAWHPDLIETGKKVGLIDLRGAHHYMEINGEQYKGTSAANFEEVIAGVPGLDDLMYEEIMRSAGIMAHYR